MNIRSILLGGLVASLASLSWQAQAQEPQRVEAHPGVSLSAPQPTRGLKWKVAVGRFSN